MKLVAGRVGVMLLAAAWLVACSSHKSSTAPQNTGGTSSGGAGAGGSVPLVAVPNDEDELPVPLAEGLAATPPMGWNSWNSYGTGVTAELIKKVADIIVDSGMKDAGYSYVNIDDGWALRTRTVLDSGAAGAGGEQAGAGGNNADAPSIIEANPVNFPPGSDGTPGIKVVADYVHEKGLKLGIYSDRGSATCGGFAASGGHEEMDARTFAGWGVDYLKYDSCNAPTDAASREAQYRAMGDALRGVDQPIVYSLCSWQFDEWNLQTGQLWRTTGDIARSFNDPGSVNPPSRTVLQNAISNSVYAAYAGPNNWNDPDMLEVGNLGNSALANVESQSHFSLWAMMAAPLIAGNKLEGMTEATRAILTNREVIAVDQDALGLQGVIVGSGDASTVWAKPLNEPGARAVLLLNTATEPQTISTSLAAIGLSGEIATLRDLWDPNDEGHAVGATFSAEVPGHGSMMYEVVGSEPAIPRGTAYLSDLTWTYAANGLGPVEKDKSNGGRAGGDGEPLRLRGKTYDKGLGVAPGSKLIYRLAKKCSRFSAVIGVDDDVAGAGSVVYQVWADGERLYPSEEPKTLTGSDPAEEIELDVTDRHRLTLLVTSAGDGQAGDRADWADAKLTCSP
jgi:alpha-galactosidase